MKTKSGMLALAFALAVTGCVDTPPSTKAVLPAAVETAQTTHAGASTVHAVTTIGMNNFYEITPLVNKDLTCFSTSTIYSGHPVSGSVDCVPKNAGSVFQAATAATVESATQVGYNDVYEITPATRPDVRCFLSSSVYTGHPVSGDVSCSLKPKL